MSCFPKRFLRRKHGAFLWHARKPVIFVEFAIGQSEIRMRISKEVPRHFWNRPVQIAAPIVDEPLRHRMRLDLSGARPFKLRARKISVLVEIAMMGGQFTALLKRIRPGLFKRGQPPALPFRLRLTTRYHI